MTSGGVSDVLRTKGKRVWERSISLLVLISLVVDVEDFIYFLLRVKDSGMRLWRGLEIIERLWRTLFKDSEKFQRWILANKSYFLTPLFVATWQSISLWNNWKRYLFFPRELFISWHLFSAVESLFGDYGHMYGAWQAIGEQCRQYIVKYRVAA